MRQIDKDLINAADNGNVDLVKKYLENGANVHADDSCSLRYAATRGHREIVELLVENGVNPNNKIAIKYASINGHFPIVKYLYHYTRMSGQYVDKEIMKYCTPILPENKPFFRIMFPYLKVEGDYLV
jgi:hypothetical protein